MICTKWKRPRFTILNLSAEIGLYQEDYDIPSDDPVRFSPEDADSPVIIPIMKPRGAAIRPAAPFVTSEV